MARRRKEEPPVDITLPITPMLDMSFQLLSFFILTFRPIATEGQMPVALPKLDVSEQVGATARRELGLERRREVDDGVRLLHRPAVLADPGGVQLRGHRAVAPRGRGRVRRDAAAA